MLTAATRTAARSLRPSSSRLLRIPQRWQQRRHLTAEEKQRRDSREAPLHAAAAISSEIHEKFASQSPWMRDFMDSPAALWFAEDESALHAVSELARLLREKGLAPVPGKAPSLENMITASLDPDLERALVLVQDKMDERGLNYEDYNLMLFLMHPKVLQGMGYKPNIKELFDNQQELADWLGVDWKDTLAMGFHVRKNLQPDSVDTMYANLAGHNKRSAAIERELAAAAAIEAGEEVTLNPADEAAEEQDEHEVPEEESDREFDEIDEDRPVQPHHNILNDLLPDGVAATGAEPSSLAPALADRVNDVNEVFMKMFQQDFNKVLDRNVSDLMDEIEPDELEREIPAEEMTAADEAILQRMVESGDPELVFKTEVAKLYGKQLNKFANDNKTGEFRRLYGMYKDGFDTSLIHRAVNEVGVDDPELAAEIKAQRFNDEDEAVSDEGWQEEMEDYFMTWYSEVGGSKHKARTENDETILDEDHELIATADDIAMDDGALEELENLVNSDRK